VVKKFTFAISSPDEFLVNNTWCICMAAYCISVVLHLSLLGEEASPSIGNALWRVSAMFTRSAITPPEVNGFG